MGAVVNFESACTRRTFSSRVRRFSRFSTLSSTGFAASR
jgi:hypothetical protein